MGKPPRVFALPRMLRHVTVTGEGLPPDGAVEVDAPDAALRAALTASRSGDWPAAGLMARTRTARDREWRGQYSAGLAELALHHTGWLEAWRQQRPDDPDTALVAAELAIDRAWEIRTAARARHVSREQFQAFHTVPRDAEPVLRTAADRNPGDPVPCGSSSPTPWDCAPRVRHLPRPGPRPSRPWLATSPGRQHSPARAYIQRLHGQVKRIDRDEDQIRLYPLVGPVLNELVILGNRRNEERADFWIL